MNKPKEFTIYTGPELSPNESLERSKEFYDLLKRRRTVRDISSKAIPEEVLTNIIKAAATAPSGANKQPWFFCLVKDPILKKKIRQECESREYENYQKRYPQAMIKDISFIGTNHIKKFIEKAPAIIVYFKKRYNEENGTTKPNYYVSESSGIALGMLFTAIHHAGLVTVPYTPMPRSFMNELLDRPRSESAVMVLPVGYPEDGALVPVKSIKGLDEIMKLY